MASFSTNMQVIRFLTSKCNSSIIISHESGLEVAALLDGGAEVNIVSKDFADKFGYDNQRWDGQIAPLGGKLVENYGITNLNFKLNNNKIVTIPAVIVDNTGKYKVVLGTPALEKLGVIINYKQGEANVDGCKYPLAPRLEKRYLPIRASDDVTVPPDVKK